MWSQIGRLFWAGPGKAGIGGSATDERRVGPRMIGVMATATGTRAPRLTAALREGERVMPLELFFDLVFVLAITQCTALMFHQPTWSGLAQGMLVLGVLWWSWTGYAWLTS